MVDIAVDPKDPTDQRVIDDTIKTCLKTYWHNLHSHYKSFNTAEEACQQPFEGVTLEDWATLCDRFG
ncbi:unnamed protein product [Ilex paraguariensis]|uniref:Uncharacterized protein n=1 Tax=Ilex paraguariensis TaxID=185542 RepID=A0ABC8R3Y4_9AQUA